MLFDVDGTLADTERDAHRVAFNCAFAEAGLDWTWDVAQYGALLRIAGGRERLAHFIADSQPDVTESECTRLVRALHELKTAHYLRIVRAGAVALRPGVLRLLREAHDAGLVLAIATTTSRANVDVLLAHALPPGAQTWFRAIGAAENARQKKPDSEIYHYVLDAIGLAAADCIAFEDSAVGLRAARGAGVTTAVTQDAYSAGQDFSGALVVLSDLGEPHALAQTISGTSPTRGYVDVAQLHVWHASVQNGTSN